MTVCVPRNEACSDANELTSCLIISSSKRLLLCICDAMLQPGGAAIAVWGQRTSLPSDGHRLPDSSGTGEPIVRSLEPANSSYARRVRVEQAIQPTERQRFRCCYKGAGRNILDGIARLAAALRLDSTNTYQTVRRHRILGGQVSGQLVGSRTR